MPYIAWIATSWFLVSLWTTCAVWVPYPVGANGAFEYQRIRNDSAEEGLLALASALLPTGAISLLPGLVTRPECF